MARRWLHGFLWLVPAVLAVGPACSGGDPEPEGGRPITTDGAEDDLPAPLASFLAEVAEPGEVAFTATYAVLRKLGGQQTTVEVVAEPPSWRIQVGDLVVVDGPRPATCRVAAQRCVGEVREQLLTDVGIFSRFFATGPRQALAAAARREGAAAPVFSSRTVAGVPLECAGVPVGGGVPTISCLTPEGVFGFVDTPAVRIELTSYGAGTTGEEVTVPYELTTDDGFLTP